MRRPVRSFAAAVVLIAAGLAGSGPTGVRADVYRVIPLGGMERLAQNLGGGPAAPPVRMVMSGRPMEIRVWRVPVDFVTATQAVERRMSDLLGSADDGTLDAFQVVNDDYAVFFSPEQPEVGRNAGMPAYRRTILVRPAPGGALMTLTRALRADRVPFSPQHERRANAWSLEGARADWWAAQELAGVDRLSVMLVSRDDAAKRFDRRLVFLKRNGFVIDSITRSEAGTMIAASRQGERANVFSYRAEDGAYTEIIDLETTVSQAGVGG